MAALMSITVKKESRLDFIYTLYIIWPSAWCHHGPGGGGGALM